MPHAAHARQRQAGINMKMSDYGIVPEELETLAKGARAMQGGLYAGNPCELSDADCAGIFAKAYR